jgi:hypothetical protein
MSVRRNIRPKLRRHDGEEWRQAPDVDGYVLRAPDLKQTIMDCYFAGYITQADAEDLIQFYGLRSA